MLGAGSAGLGICRKLVQAMQAEGMSEEEALQNFFLVDIHGLIHTKLTDATESQKKFAQNFETIAKWKVKDPTNITLLEVVQNAQPSVLIGVSAQPGTFTEEIVKTMAAHQKQPIILPLSNPTSKCEAEPKNLIQWTEGRAIIATGSPLILFLSMEKRLRLHNAITSISSQVWAWA